MLQDVELTGGAGEAARFVLGVVPTEPGSAGGPAVHVSGSRLGLSACTLAGGRGGDGIGVLEASGALACELPRAGGDALWFAAGGPSSVTMSGSGLLPGRGGAAAPQCGTGSAASGSALAGPALSTATIEQRPSALSLDGPAVLSAPCTVTLDLLAEPVPSLQFLAVSPTSMVGLVETVGMTSFVGPAINLVSLGPFGSLPVYSLTANVGPLPPGTPFRDLFVQGVQVDTAVRLTAPLALTIE